MESKVSAKWDGKQRTLYKSSCQVCGKEMWTPLNRLEKRKYCSRECDAARRRSKVKAKCDHCGNEFELRLSKVENATGLHFCSRACKDRAQTVGGKIAPPHYKTGITAYRKRTIKEKGAVCERCGFKEDDRLLDVHHIDGNRQNNRPNNLEVLCVMCHARETRKDWPKIMGI